MKLLYNITDQTYMVLNIIEGAYYLFKVDNFNPPMLSRIIENGSYSHTYYHRERIIDEMGEFALREYKKLNDGW